MGNDHSSRHSRSHKHISNNHDPQPITLVASGGGDDDHELQLKPQRSRMEKIRRSLSFRKKKSTKHKSSSSSADPPAQQAANPTTASSAPAQASMATSSTAASVTTAVPDPSKPSSWQDDERKVREGTCSFHVKYLGFVEVTDSRGMHICEQAIEKLLAAKKKAIKAILYVSGDSLRVVDESNKTLLLDQTIEKVSFCAPDRYHENGFAYICRDGTTRRWLCHGFMAVKDTIRNVTTNSSGGERLSHAVGCAFSVCLERKQKRERENVTMELGPNHSFTRFGSFRQASISERLEDPQVVMPRVDPVPIRKVENPHAIERPRGNPEILNRQNSLRSSMHSKQFARNSPQYTSLRPGELPSFQQQKLNSIFASKKDSSATVPSPPTQQPQAITEAKIIQTISEVPEPDTSVLSGDSKFEVNFSAAFDNTNVPPPLPPMPARNLSPNPLLSSSAVMFGTPNTTVAPPPPPTYNTALYPSQQMFSSPGVINTVPSIFATPQTPSYSYMSHVQPSQFVYQPHHMIAQQTTPNTSTNSANNETFEAKFARLQAAKKHTNPFAEDIAKKFEIKL